MPFYATAYDTTAGRGVNINKIAGAIQQSLLKENFALVNNQQQGIEMPIPQDGCVPTLVTTQTDVEMDIPVFSHPVYVDLSAIRKSSVENYMVSDARPFMIGKPTDRDGRLVVKNQTEFDFTKNRTILSSHWYKRNTDSFKHLSASLTAIYAAWVSEAISRRFGLDPKDQHYLAILAAYHYQSLFYTDTKFDENDRLKIAPVVAKSTYAEIDLVLEVLDRFTQMEGIFDYCKAARELTENPRLEELNPALLVTMVSTSWIGTNGREIAAVALEHVPTFVMMTYGAFTERTYKLAALSKITDRFKGRKGEDEFLRNLKTLIAQIKTS